MNSYNLIANDSMLYFFMAEKKNRSLKSNHKPGTEG